MKITKCPRCNKNEFLSENPVNYALSRRPKNKNIKICNQCGKDEEYFDTVVIIFCNQDSNMHRKDFRFFSKEIIKEMIQQEQAWLNEK